MKRLQAFLRLFSVTAIIAGLVIQVLTPTMTSAAQITNRSLTLMSGGTDTDGNGINDGGSMPGGVANHLFEFDLSGGTVGSIKFQYCTTAAAVAGGIDCDAPVGANATGGLLGDQTGVATGFSKQSSNANTFILTRPAAAVIAGSSTFRLDGIVNPTTTNQTFFVRISTHTSTDATDAAIDSGTVAASTASAIELDGTMPESLVFCTGETIPLTPGGVPDCANATDGAISFNMLFSPTDTATAKSQMAASTNAGQGYVITVNGPTLTSGSNTIKAMGVAGNTATTSLRGTSQFGINLKANTVATSTPAIGDEVSPTSDAVTFTGRALPGYDTVDNFKFETANAVADSFNSGTDAQIFTASYMVNVPGNQPAGTYATTLTYIGTPTF